MNKVLQNGAFFTVRNGSCTDEGIVDEMLLNDAEITDTLQKEGVITKNYAKVMTPES